MTVWDDFIQNKNFSTLTPIGEHGRNKPRTDVIPALQLPGDLELSKYEVSRLNQR